MRSKELARIEKSNQSQHSSLSVYGRVVAQALARQASGHANNQQQGAPSDDIGRVLHLNPVALPRRSAKQGQTAQQPETPSATTKKNQPSKMNNRTRQKHHRKTHLSRAGTTQNAKQLHLRFTASSLVDGTVTYTTGGILKGLFY